jgi:GNAT superfamily N-acetyltransferase
VAPATTHDLRREVLRGGRADADVTWTGDDERETFHLAVIDEDTAGDETPVGVATFLDRACPVRPGRFPARQVRGMAVAEDRQGEGIGSALLAAGLERCRDDGVAVVWAHAREPVVPWYEAHGLVPEGDVYDRSVGDRTLPHRTVVLDLGVGST